MQEMWGEEIARAADAHSIIAEEIKIAREFDAKIHTEKRLPEIAEIPGLLADGNLLIANLNSYKLNEKEGYAGHFVVIVGCGKDYLFLHDPGGAPGHPNRKVSLEQFNVAWAYPDDRAKSLMAIKPAI